MSPSAPTRIESPAPLRATFPVSPLDEPSLNKSAAQGQHTVADRPKHRWTPTPRGQQFQDDIRRGKAISAKIRQTKARKSLGKSQGRRKGKGKRTASPVGSDTCDTNTEDEEDNEGNDSDGSWIVDDDTIVPTSDPRELEQEGGTTFQTQLDDPEFRANISEHLTTLFGETQEPSRETLKKVLHFVRRNKEATLGSSQWYSQADSLPDQAVEGGGGFHLDYEPQPGQKRRFVAPQLGSSKRGRLTTSGTPSTVLDDNPNPIPQPTFPVLTGSMDPPLLPRSATDPDPLDPPPQLPISAASPVPARSRSPEPDNTNSQWEDTQTVPETPTQHAATQPRSALLPERRPSRPSTQPVTTSSHASARPGSEAVSCSASQLEAMSARFDRNERHRARAYTILQQRKKSKHAGADDDDLMEDDTADQEEAMNSAKSKPARRKPKSGLNCQVGRPRQAATRAVTDVSAYSFAKNPYFTRGTGIIWSLEAYERAFAVEFPGAPLEPATPELISAICDRVPGARTVLKASMRSSIATSYGFKAEPESQKEIDANLKTYQEIYEDFHFGSLTDPQSHYEHPALKKAFLAGFFAARHSPCVVYHHYFNPVPVETIVTLLVMMDACIAEWRTGALVKEHLNAKEQSVLYDKHMANIELFALGAPGRLLKMRKDFYAAGLRKVVPKANPESSTKATIHLSDVRADMPPPAGSDPSADTL